MSFVRLSCFISILLLHLLPVSVDARGRRCRSRCRRPSPRPSASTTSLIHSPSWEAVYDWEASATFTETPSITPSSSRSSVSIIVYPSSTLDNSQTLATSSATAQHDGTLVHTSSLLSSYLATSGGADPSLTVPDPVPTTLTTSQASTHDGSAVLTTTYASEPAPTSDTTSETISLSTFSSDLVVPSSTPSMPSTSSASTPAEFTPVNEALYVGRNYQDSDHFRVYAASTDPIHEALSMLEGQYDCFVNRLNWRSSGLSIYNVNSTGPYYKTNIVVVDDLGGSAGVQRSDWNLGVASVDVLAPYLAASGVTCHEFGHALHYHQQTWVGQARTGAWWESVANWFADTYETSDLCGASREAVGRGPGQSLINVHKVIGDSFQVIVDGSVGSGNYYQAWPFLTYLTNNPDGYEGLGSDTVRQLMVQYAPNSNEDPLHTLSRVAGVPVSTIVGRYWARMAYVDIANDAAQQVFNHNKASINYVNVQKQGPNTYQVLEDRKPRYMGANIIPLDVTGSSAIEIDVVADGDYTATLAIRGADAGAVRYIDVVDTSGPYDIAPGEEAMLVIANTPSELILYNAFALTDDVQQGMTYSFTLTGASVDPVAMAPASS